MIEPKELAPLTQSEITDMFHTIISVLEDFGKTINYLNLTFLQHQTDEYRTIKKSNFYRIDKRLKRAEESLEGLMINYTDHLKANLDKMKKKPLSKYD